MYDNRPGFTLIEVMVAIVVGAVVMLGARALLDGLSLHSERVQSKTRHADASAGAEHVLRSAVGRASLASDSTDRFDGTVEEVRFGSWCDMAGGWQERCDVRLAVEREGSDSGLSVVVHLGDFDRVEVAQHRYSASFRYLASAANGGQWLERWEQAIVPPLAVGLITRSTAASPPDTMILRVAERS